MPCGNSSNIICDYFIQVHYLVRRPEADAAQGSRSKRPNKETRTNSEVVASKNKKKKMHAN
jgi:hypothetical protein